MKTQGRRTGGGERMPLLMISNTQHSRHR